MSGTRTAMAVLTANIGNDNHRRDQTSRLESYAFDAAMDIDGDQFSIDVGDPDNKRAYLLERDTEVLCSIFLEGLNGQPEPQFYGVADQVVKDSEDMTLSISGRDLSSLAQGDALPGKWRHVQPKQFIRDRARALGFPAVSIPAMSEIGTLYQDGSETEWAFWYRIARKKKMWMWTLPNGTLVIDKLGYSLAPSYNFGHGRGAVMPERVTITKDTSGRIGESWVYAIDHKTNIGFRGRSQDIHIRAWRRLPVKVKTSSTAKNSQEAQDEAHEEIFESIVGAFEIELTLHDTKILVMQNKMARVNIPELDLVGDYFIVGVRKQGGMGGEVQVVRLRQKQYALSRRVPTDPKLDTPNDQSVAGSVAAALGQLGKNQGVRWPDSFVRAAREFGVANGWDMALFLGVLLSICWQESQFQNVRESGNYEWQPPELFRNDPRNAGNEAQVWRKYEKTFANSASNPDNPFRGTRHNAEAGVGPMQLTSLQYKQWADQYGWSGRPNTDELRGGRWNPDSNIRAAARALIEKLAGVDPTKAENIWIGVRNYNGSGPDADNYRKVVKGHYDTMFAGIAAGAVAVTTKVPVGTQTRFTVPGHGELEAPADTPDAVKKAINFAIRRFGDRYEWGGSGPYYDCSSFVTAAYASASSALRATLDEPKPGHHGESTYTLWTPNRFQKVLRDNIRAGDLLFFDHGGSTPEHVGMYLGDGLMIHDSHPGPGGGVKVSSINADYYRDRWMGARRLVNWPYQNREPE